MATTNTNFKVKNGLDAGGDISTTGVLKSTNSATNEGGQVELSLPSSGTTLSGTNVTIDVYQDKLRFFESGGTNRGAYIPLTSTGASVGTSLLGGTTGAMNYAQTEGTKQSGISSVGTSIVSVSITTNGYPVLVNVTGDVENNSAGGWVVLQLYRGSTAIGNPVHAESSAGSENVPYALSVIDAPSAGTYTYALKINNSAGGTFNFGESDGPVITAIELSGPKGDTGSAGASGLTSVGISLPTGLSVSNSPLTSDGTLAVTFTSGYSIPTTTSQTNWNTAYGWGNHASAGYLTTSSAASTYQTITPTEIPNAADLNTYTTTGTYVQSSNAEASAGTNYPEAVAGTLRVVANSNASEIWQTYHTLGGASTNKVYQRGYYVTWSAWKEVATTSSIGSTIQAWDTDLDGLASLSTTGLVKRTGSGSFATVTESYPNYILNGAFDIAQRGTSGNSVSGGSGGASSAYLLDQWVFTAGGTAAPATTIVATSQLASTANMISGYDFPYYATFATTLVAGSTVTSASYMSQRIEDVRTLAGQQVTLSFWAKVASGTNSNFVPVIEQNFGTGGSASVTNTGSALSLTTTWTRFSYTVTLGSMSGKTIGTNSYLDVRPLQLPGANFAGGITVSIAGVKLEANSSATAFMRKNPSVAAEQLECYRYYWRFGGSGTSTQVSISNGAYYNTTSCYTSIKHPVPMRTAPSFSVNDVTGVTAYALSASKASTNIVGGTVVSRDATEVTITTAAITTTGAASMLRYPANSTNYMEFSAEI